MSRRDVAAGVAIEIYQGCGSELTLTLSDLHRALLTLHEHLCSPESHDMLILLAVHPDQPF